MHKKQPNPVLFEKIPGRMCYQLKRLVSHTVLENGHVFLGFSKCGKFVVSYSLQVGGEQTNDHVLPIYDYRLQWWLFVPNKPLQLVSEVKLFGGDDIFKELFLAFCEWPEDDQKVFVYGQSIPSPGEDSCFCYVTITSIPCLGRCSDCQNEQSKPAANDSGQSKVERKCLLHDFCVYSKYDMNPPYPAFSPNVQLKLNGTVILNTGISLKAKEYRMCDNCNQISCDCVCPKVVRQPLQDKNGGGMSVRTSEQSNNFSVSSPRASASGKYLHENIETSNEYSTSLLSEKPPVSNYVFSSPSPRICSERSFFSPSNSNSSVTSKSSEGVHVHTNLAKTVTYSSRCYSIQQEEITDSQVSMEDEYDLAYRSILPVDVSAGGKTLSVAKNVSAASDIISVLQMTFDIEPYMMETIHLRAEWGRRFVSFYNYDLQILDVEQDGQIIGTVCALIQAKESNEKSKRYSKVPIKMYRTQITFRFNLCKGIYSTLNIDDLSEVQERNPCDFEWKSGNKECNLIRRKAIIPKSFFRSVHMLSNECLFKGRSKKILMASHHSHSSAIIL
ncbi:hypothetical protein LOTGIDRAFT_219013 [Lottia gigantea]|uniref:DDB1- and CUL4-associated factor 15 WD40 repeat-containing domain-containing protein n=1 Tax=Lottia gigantea TaxID=225164 RepID=V3ZWX6_LOTGI|nr:hypothetical protein LOTGIDRAFT_219013 [Lottia gigantea]ESO88862.1 hypothetical protein LOTGIDRAFT_219013 [Lottia gigantea]